MTDVTDVVVWHPRIVPALLAALASVSPVGATPADLARLLGCARQRLVPSEADPSPRVLAGWLATAHAKGVAFELAARPSEGVLFWRATAVARVLG